MPSLNRVIAAVFAALVFSSVFMDVMPQVITIAVLMAIPVYFILRNMEGNMRAPLTSLFAIAFLLQVIASISIYERTLATKYYGFSYMGDDYVYGDFGTIVGGLWRSGIFPSLKKLAYYTLVGKNVTPNAYQLYNAAVFYLFGTCGGQILLIVNCFFHAIVIIPVYYICRDLNISNKATLFALFLILFWPSLLYWSLFNFKEPILTFCVFAALALLARVRERARLSDIAAVTALLLVVTSLRVYFLIFLICAPIYFLFFWKWAYKKFFILGALIVILLMQLLGKYLFSDLYVTIESLPFTSFDIRHSSAFSNTAYFTDLITFTYPRTIAYLPMGILAIIFLPFLLRPISVAHIGANIESILWWVLLPLLLGGIWISIREELKKTLPMLFVFFYWLFMLALTSGNMGTLVRLKSLLYCVGFIFIALAADRAIKRQEEKRI